MDIWEKRIHILEGIITAVENMEIVIEIIRNSITDDAIKKGLAKRFNFSEEQVQAILGMRIELLKKSEVEKIKSEYAKLKNN